jgi:hypothetical protein
MKHLGTAEDGKTVGRSSCGGELSPAWGSTEMISNRRSDTNRQILIKGVREHLLPSAQSGPL